MSGFGSLLPDTSFVVADAVFVNPKQRGFRLPPVATTDMTTRREMFVRHRIRIHDARLRSPPPTLECEGFQLFDSPIRMGLGERELVSQRYYEYCEKLLKTAVRCQVARTVQHEFRTGFTGAQSYAQSVHADVCPYIEDVVQAPGGHHFAIFTVWRATSPGQTVEGMPLALCDVRTVADEDIVYADAWRKTEPKTRLVDCRLIYNTAQRWYYFPNMRPNEALIFKQYDSRQGHAALRASFHTAFMNPETPDGAPLRQSVEARALVIFPERDHERASRIARFKDPVPKLYRDGSVSDWRHEEMLDWRSVEGETGEVKESSAATW